MRNSPSVRRMVMFKHGVAFLERSGPAEGSFELSFSRDEMNDVLKSLAVWVASGDARVGAVAFDKPEDPEKALARRKLLLEPGDALHALLGTLRGRRVSVERADGGSIEGDVLGIDGASGAGGHHHGERPPPRVLLRTDEGRVALVALDSARSLTLLEAPSRADLEFLVDRSRAATAGESRIVRVALAGRADDLRISYVIPAPVWRVSYRIAGEGDGAVLMAWGVVHNPADEDLDDIELTLTTGQPVSFVIDLYNPKEVRRVVVEETARVAAAPTRFENAPLAQPAPVGGAAGFGPPQGFGAPAPAPAPAPMARPPAPQAPGMGAAMAQSTAVDASGHERGELFEYRVAGKVSLKRGASAMVPLLSARLAPKKERIWRAGTTSSSPDLVLQFDNATGAVLEEGPAVYYADGVYAGEAMVPYSARGVTVRLAVAKDLAVRCKSRVESRTVSVRLSLAQDALVEEQREERSTELVAESDHAEPVVVTFELAKDSSFVVEQGEGAQPTEETLSSRRFALTVAPGGKAVATVRESRPRAGTFQYANLAQPWLESWHRSGLLAPEHYKALSRVLASQAQARDFAARAQESAQRRADAYAKQEKITQQLGVLKESGAEGELRRRYVQELQGEQDKVNAAEADGRRFASESARCASEAKSMLDALLHVAPIAQ